MRSIMGLSGRIGVWVVVQLLFPQIYVLQRTMMVTGLFGAARRQKRSWGRIWQPDTVREYVNQYQAELASLAMLQGEGLLKTVQRQSRPRRWPWQPKTIRDLIDERSAEVVVVAAEWSAQLANAVAKRRDALVAAAQQQSRPRRWPWQPKTVHDRVREQSAHLATIAAERSAQLAAQARRRRDALIKEARRQSRPRRWPWQPKTLQDHLSDGSARAGMAALAVMNQVNTARERVQQQAAEVVPAVQEAASTTTNRLRSVAEKSLQTVQHSAKTATETLNDAAGTVSTTVSATADTAASTLQRPVTAVSSGVQTGKRAVRRGVRLLRTALWAALIGIAIGLLVAPATGQELRRHLRALADQLMRALNDAAPNNNA